ncbi:NTP transferase domain-containing protein [Mesorhizobium sp.]|uniref:NTP transferase domain-containing protein n=1 Tax=Mesorhizobium sp. TaxID=1871066 RepID=UPI0025F285E3|nr:NTP transferase domain-containing protein [Mesorhizobium sp.]
MGQGVAAIILAGRLSQRMGGGDKLLLPLSKHRLIDHVAARLKPHVVTLAIIEQHGFVAVELPTIEADNEPNHPFFNVNTRGDLAAAERMLQSLQP